MCIHVLTFIGHLEVAEVEFLKRAVGKQPEFEHEQTIVSTAIVGDVELSQGARARLRGREKTEAKRNEWDGGPKEIAYRDRTSLRFMC